MKKEIKFPTMDLTIEDWNGENFNEIYLYDQFLYVNSNIIFEKYCLNHIVIDHNGNLFKITGKKPLGKWRKHIPYIKKSKLIFTKLEKKMSFIDVKEFYLKRINNLNASDMVPQSVIDEWLIIVNNSTSISELFDKSM